MRDYLFFINNNRHVIKCPGMCLKQENSTKISILPNKKEHLVFSEQLLVSASSIKLDNFFKFEVSNLEISKNPYFKSREMFRDKRPF